MKTECTSKQLEFDGVGRRKLVATFDADHITSDGGLVLLHRTDGRFGLMRKFAACFRDLRAPDLIHHSVEELVRQRVFGIACGYEDLADHASLRNDPLLSAVVGKTYQLAVPRHDEKPRGVRPHRLPPRRSRWRRSWSSSSRKWSD